MKNALLNAFLPALILLSACKKEDKVIQAPPLAATKGVYVLSEGNFGANNSKLLYRDAATGAISGDFFSQQNPTITAGLGDSGNDMIIYGGKLYIVMNVSSNVTVLNAATATFIRQISLVNSTGNRQPRFAVGAKGKVYVSSYDGTVTVIDTASLNITNVINVGANPEGIEVYGNYLYTANSGGFNPVFDSTVSVVDLSTELEIKKIRVGINPQKIEANSQGDLYVSSFGNFGSITPSITVINGVTNTLKTTLSSEFSYDHLRIHNDTAYFYNNYGGAGTAKVYNTITNTIIRNEFVTDGTTISVPYGINIDEQNGDVYVADAIDFSSSGRVTCFDRNGVRKFSFSVAPGVNPNKILFVR